MDWRLALVSALTLPTACTIFNGLTPLSPEAGSDGGTDATHGDTGPSHAPCDDAGVCVPGQGLCEPQARCSPEAPCANGVIFSLDGGGLDQGISVPINLPLCKTADSQDTVMTWADKNGATRAACVYKPVSGLKPLVVFLHPLGGSADDVYNLTTLRAAAVTTQLGDGVGFALAANQGENLHHADSLPSGPEHDFYYRNFGSNPDFQAVDYLIDTLVTLGGIDTSRIYLIGWGEGAFFAQEYAIVRNVTVTPGGNRVAAAAVFDGADPFQSPSATEADCKLNTYPQSQVAIEIVHRACSLIPCDASQQAAFGAPPGYDVEDWTTTLRNAVGVDPEDHIIDALGIAALTCASSCSSSQAAARGNTEWPSTWESSMLGFLASHAL